MSNYGSLLLSKVVDNNEVSALERHGITEKHLVSDTDKEALRFIRQYAKTNRGKAPSYAALVEAVPAFTYIPAVEDSYVYLTKRLFNEAADEALANFINGEVDKEVLRKDPDATLASLYENNADDMPTLMDKLAGKIAEIRRFTDVRDKVGFDIKNDTERALEEYRRRKAGDSHKTWNSRFASIGKYASGNVTVFFGKSGRGKSVVTLADAIYMAQQGATVLVWGMEMSEYEILARIYSIMSADEGIYVLREAGVDMDAGFDASDIRNGTLSDEFEEKFEAFIRGLNDSLEGNLIVRGADDDSFEDRSLAALESDILHVGADVVLLDAFYHMDYETNTSRTAGGDAAETSKQLRKLTGRLGVVTMAITQADEIREDKSDDGSRELVLPQRGDVKKTKSLLEDANILVAIDTDYKQGRGLVGNVKGRNGGEGDVTEIMYMPQHGNVRSLYDNEVSVTEFEF